MTSNPESQKTRVLVVDDSALIRQVLTRILSSDPGIDVVGIAHDPLFAREKIEKLRPDVLTLDIEMPRMDGLTFLADLMKEHPMPVVMISSLTQKGCDTTLRALELGAVDFFPKPIMDTKDAMAAAAAEIIQKVKTAARIQIRQKAVAPKTATPLRIEGISPAQGRGDGRIIAIGASTGGTEAIREVLEPLPKDLPGIVMVQHMPPGFTSSFAKRLDGVCALSVREARDGDPILPGQALLAPGDFQMQVVRSGGVLRVRVVQDPPVNLHRPSVDYLFDSVAEHAGAGAIGIILTGMGADGARGMRRMWDNGARTIAQDESSCVVYGMPKEAVAHGGAEFVLPLSAIPTKLVSLVREVGARKPAA